MVTRTATCEVDPDLLEHVRQRGVPAARTAMNGLHRVLEKWIILSLNRAEIRLSFALGGP